MNPSFKNPFEKMLQGLAYWLAYQNTILGCDVIESDAVKEAFMILQTYLISDYKVKREYPLKNFSDDLGRQRADLAIVNKENDKCICLIEFKLADATNGGYSEDVEKLYKVKEINQEIDCYVIVLFRHPCKIDEPKELVTNKGNAIRNAKCKKNSLPINVRRVCKAIRSLKVNPSMNKTILIEVLHES